MQSGNRDELLLLVPIFVDMIVYYLKVADYLDDAEVNWNDVM